MKKDMCIAVFPGSFDPFTKGHLDIIERALPLFDKLIVAIGINSSKKYFFDLEMRLEMIRRSLAHLGERIEVGSYEKLTAHYCQEQGAGFILRGLRNATDFDYENTISKLNTVVGEGIETVFFISSPTYDFYSSTIVREIIRGGGDARMFLPQAIWTLALGD